LELDDEVDGDEGDSEERDDDDVELGWLGGFGSSLSPPLELDGDGVFALEPGAAGRLAGWLALVDACRSMGGLAGCAGVADADCGNAAVCGCTAGAALVGVGANEEVAVRGDSTAVRACGTGAGLVGVGVNEVGKGGIAFGKQVSTAGLPDEAGIVAPELGGGELYQLPRFTPPSRTCWPRAAAAPALRTGPRAAAVGSTVPESGGGGAA
jgi:hypothetical protein